MSLEPPIPKHLFRSHSHPITSLAWSSDTSRLYSTDTSGKVVVTSSISLRAFTIWKAHESSILGVEEWEDRVLTHGRDNKLHVWERLKDLPFSQTIGGSAQLPNLPTPTLCYSMDINALNFCRFSLFSQSGRALIALPNLIDSSTVDIWSLPSKDRIHAAIGQETNIPFQAQTTRNTSGIVMGIHLYDQRPTSSSESKHLRLLSAYESGAVVLRQYNRIGRETSVEGQGWDIIWKAKLHVDTIMAMRVSRGNTFALSVSADHIVGRYDLTTDSPSENHGIAYRTKHPGNGCIALREDGKVCAIGGWDGKIRLYSTKSFKSLGTLKYHKQAVQCLEFAPIQGDDDEDEMSTTEKLERSLWLVAGSKDNRVSVWPLIDFAK